MLPFPPHSCSRYRKKTNTKRERRRRRRSNYYNGSKHLVIESLPAQVPRRRLSYEHAFFTFILRARVGKGGEARRGCHGPAQPYHNGRGSPITAPRSSPTRWQIFISSFLVALPAASHYLITRRSHLLSSAIPFLLLSALVKYATLDGTHPA